VSKEATMIKLYDLELSGNCYKVRLFAALAQIPLEIVPVDFMAGAHKKPPLVTMNPLGEIPILVDGELVLRDSQAILIYLAGKYGGEAWWPKEPAHQALVAQWLFTAANEVQHGPADARLVDKFGYKLDKATALSKSAAVLPVLDAHLARRQWLEMQRPTIADIAVFPYVALAPEGGVSLEPYPAVREWIDRIKALPHFLSMPGV
jgi:glutathione S-transferase